MDSKKSVQLLVFLCISAIVFGQGKGMDYFFPNQEFNKEIPSPETYFKFKIGEWHLSHDRLLPYLMELDRLSNRMSWIEYGRSVEGRPLGVFIITAPENHSKLEQIRQQHLQLSDPNFMGKVDESLPVVVYQGHSIHGNEASGAHAAVCMAYYWAAGQGADIETKLKNTVILFDPCFNPDGLSRFSTWVNQNKSQKLVSDASSREFSETWPGGRFNHYWFDLNRDWLVCQMPESEGRVRLFQQWRPNVLTDHHEMGSNSTFYFHPGVPTRIHPLTPAVNQTLTAKLATFHSKALDKIGSLYYTKENFDDFYYGKGSTYPDIQGCVGILFEQGSSRGHLQKTVNGDLSFAFTIRNQVTASLSTIEGANVLKKELFEYQSGFYKDALKAGREAKNSAYIFDNPTDPTLPYKLAEMLNRHSIQIFRLKKDMSQNGMTFTAKSGFIIPTDQPQYKLIQSCFERRFTFHDSIFYDISSWTLPIATGVQDAEVSKGITLADYQGTAFANLTKEQYFTKTELPDSEDVAYCFSWNAYYAPQLLFKAMEEGLVARVNQLPFEAQTASGKKSFAEGTIILTAQQRWDKKSLRERLQQLANQLHVEMTAIQSGLAINGVDLGSPNINPIRKLQAAMIVGDGVTALDAGEIWQLLDRHYEIPLTLLDIKSVGNLDKYNTLILSDGNYTNSSPAFLTKLKDWTNGGGTLIAFGNSNKYLKTNGLLNASFKTIDTKNNQKKGYGSYDTESGSKVLSGAICSATMDLTHPLCFGYSKSSIGLFKSDTLCFDLPQNSYAAPIYYTAAPALSGYFPRGYTDKVANTPACIVNSVGSGRVIAFLDNMAFRGFWFGTNKLLANALFFGGMIKSGTMETAEKKNE